MSDWVPCARMLMRVSTPSSSAQTMTTRSRGVGGMPGATQGERGAEVVFKVWEWWFLKFDLPLCNYVIVKVAS